VQQEATAAQFSFCTSRLRGVNLGGWFSQVDDLYSKDPDANPGLHAHLQTFLGGEDFRRVRAWGFNHVRLPVDYYVVFDRESLVPDPVAMDLLDRAVRQAEASGLGVILDLHRCPGHDFHSGTLREQAFFHDPDCRRDAKRVWSVLAGRFGNRPLVALEILNEPVAPDAQTWNSVKDEMFAHIRAAAPRSTVVVGANRWNNPSQLAELVPVDDANVLYSVHCYAPLLFTHQRAPWMNREVFGAAVPWPGDYGPEPAVKLRLAVEYGYWDKARLARSLQAAAEGGSTFRSPAMNSASTLRHPWPTGCGTWPTSWTF
jgi:aryl-phospho-beta-D-glucosidase BglC (GH1 family)